MMLVNEAIADRPGLENASERAVCHITEWLAGDECHELDLSGLIAGFGVRLRVAGIPLDRMALHIRTLHPLLQGRAIAWGPGEPTEVIDFQHGGDTSALLRSPVHQVLNTHEWLTIRPGNPLTNWSTPEVFRDRNLAELLIVPLLSGGPLASAATFGTRHPTGFSVSQRALLQAVIPALRSALELKLSRGTETTLLATYVGTAAGQRILAGHIRRGDVETLDAALMLCDLRGFTALSNQLPEEGVLELLNAYFDRVIPAIVDSDGEILKFMGDAVLAYFHDDNGPAASCAAAFDAAKLTLERLATSAHGGLALQAGIALHYGRVSYGNIGSGKRLDFTVIGRDVNLLSRIQSVCAATGRPLLMSERFANLLAVPNAVSIGRHNLKGISEAVELITLTKVGDRIDAGNAMERLPMLYREASALRALAGRFDMQPIRDQLLDLAARCEKLAKSLKENQQHADLRLGHIEHCVACR